jgi:hypothetical protein
MSESAVNKIAVSGSAVDESAVSESTMMGAQRVRAQWVGGGSKSATCEGTMNEIAVSQRSNSESAMSEIAVSEDTMSEIAVSACSDCDRSECCHAVLSCCAVTLCALSQYSRTVCSRLCTFTLVLSPAGKDATNWYTKLS